MLGTVKQVINKKGWNIECVQTGPSRWMNVDITFYNDMNKQDETEFSIRSYDVNELS